MAEKTTFPQPAKPPVPQRTASDISMLTNLGPSGQVNVPLLQSVETNGPIGLVKAKSEQTAEIEVSPSLKPPEQNNLMFSKSHVAPAGFEQELHPFADQTLDFSVIKPSERE